MSMFCYAQIYMDDNIESDHIFKKGFPLSKKFLIKTSALTLTLSGFFCEPAFVDLHTTFSFTFAIFCVFQVNMSFTCNKSTTKIRKCNNITMGNSGCMLGITNDSYQQQSISATINIECDSSIKPHICFNGRGTITILSTQNVSE